MLKDAVTADKDFKKRPGTIIDNIVCVNGMQEVIQINATESMQKCE